MGLITLQVQVEEEVALRLLAAATSVKVIKPAWNFSMDGADWIVGKSVIKPMVGLGFIHEALIHREISALTLAGGTDLTLASNQVSSAVRRAREAIRELEPEIDTHLQQYLSAGHYVRYGGDWEWSL